MWEGRRTDRLHGPNELDDSDAGARAAGLGDVDDVGKDWSEHRQKLCSKR